MFNKEQYKKIRDEIPDSVKILAATKTKPVEDITEAVNSGIKIIGENYIQEAEQKYKKLKSFFREKNVSFHLIGSLQSNKAKRAAEIFDCIETIDSLKLAEKINNACKELRKKIKVMIEVNFGEEQKSGISLEELDFLINSIIALENLELTGLMCIPPIGQEEECYKAMKNLKEKYNLQELSMGMSLDYKLAIKDGSTLIRLGTVLFGKREEKT